LLHKLKCNQCGSKDVTLKLISNEVMSQYDYLDILCAANGVTRNGGKIDK